MSKYSPIDNDYKNGLMINNYNNCINTKNINNIYDVCFPIGYIMTFIDNTNPNDIYKNTTWELINFDAYIGCNFIQSPFAGIKIAPVGSIVGQKEINIIDTDNEENGIYKNGLYNWGITGDKKVSASTSTYYQQEATSYALRKDLKISNELPHIKVKAWKRTK